MDSIIEKVSGTPVKTSTNSNSVSIFNGTKIILVTLLLIYVLRVSADITVVTVVSITDITLSISG